MSETLIFCPIETCICFPFICIRCNVCKEGWWIHNTHGINLRSSCKQCYQRERRLTNQALKIGVKTGKIIEDSKTWWEIFTKGINPEVECTHPNWPTEYHPQILKVICRKQIPWVPCRGPEIRAENWETCVSRSRGKRAPEEYGCCREDGTPCCSKQQSRQRRQRRTKVGKTILPYSEGKRIPERERPDGSAKHLDKKGTKENYTNL